MNTVRLFSPRGRGRGGRGSARGSPRKPHGRQGNELSFALDWLNSHQYLDNPQSDSTKLTNVRYEPLTAQSMDEAGKQLGRALVVWQATFPDRAMPLVLDIGGGGRNVANTIGARGMKHVVDAIERVKDSVHLTLVRAHSISLGDDGLKQVRVWGMPRSQGLEIGNGGRG